MFQSRPFSYMHARPPEGKPFAAAHLHQYHRIERPTDTSHVRATIQHLEADAEHPSASLTAEDRIKISRSEMDLPDHIRAAGPVQRRGNMAAHIDHLKTLLGNADTHNEALQSGFNQLSPKPQAGA